VFVGLRKKTKKTFDLKKITDYYWSKFKKITILSYPTYLT